MTYEQQRRIKIKIIEVIQQWAEEHGFETSSDMEADGATRIFNELDGEFKEE